jgi:lipid-A-disaccharide synthase
MTGVPDKPGPLVYLVVGEPSGDQLAAHLVEALREATGGRVRFAGLAGERMQALGLASLFPIRELALMAAELIPRLPRLVGRLLQTERDIRRQRPDVVVTVDAQTFSEFIRARCRGLGIPLVQYVAPTVWAWRPGRAAKLARHADLLLSVFPFEPPYFEPHGLKTVYVGHAAAEAADRAGDGPALRRRLGIAADAPVLCALPGSRRGEVSRLLPLFRETIGLLAPRRPGLVAVVPTVPLVAETVRAAAASWPIPTHVLEAPADKYDAFAAADVALAASGTVTTETTFARLPTVVVYRIKPFSAAVARRMLRIKHASAVNLVMDRDVLPEYIQEACKPGLVALALERLMTEPAERRAQLAGMEEAIRRLSGPGGEKPSRVAARAVLELVRSWRKP